MNPEGDGDFDRDDIDTQRVANERKLCPLWGSDLSGHMGRLERIGLLNLYLHDSKDRDQFKGTESWTRACYLIEKRNSSESRVMILIVLFPLAEPHILV